jgi:hypothetical protein
MTKGHALRLIPSLLLAAVSLVASPSQAQTLGPTVNVSNTKSDATTTSMAVSASNVYVVWVDDKGTYQPLFSRSTNSGSSFSTAVQVFSGPSTVSPHVAATGTNVYLARSARSSPKSPGQIYFRRSTDSGATFGSQIQVSNTSVDGAIFAAMAISGNNVYIVWTQPVAGHSDVFFARSSTSGASFLPPVNLSETASSNVAGGVKLVADGSGVHVAWSENSQIYYRGSMDGGENFGGVINVSNNGNTNVIPDLAVSGSLVYLAWREHASGETTPHIFFARSVDMGGSFLPVGGMDLSGATSDTRGVAGGPQLAASGSDVHVIWHANPSGGNYDVFYTGSIDGGASFPVISNISCSLSPGCAYGALNSPTGVIAANGANVYISWSGGSSTAREIYMAHSGNSGVTFGTNINVSSTIPADSGGPQLVAAAPAEVHVMWLDHMPGNWDVFYRRSIP